MSNQRQSDKVVNRTTKLINVPLFAIFLATSGCGGSDSAREDAEAAFRDRDYAAAQVNIRNAVQQNPDDPALIFLNGQIALITGDVELAKTELAKLANNKAYAAKATPLLAKAYLLSGNGRKALDLLGESFAGNADTYAIAVAAHLTMGQTVDAMALLDKGLAAYPGSVELLLIDGARANARGEEARAREIAQDLKKRAPNNLDVRLFVGRLALEDRNFDEAEVHFDAVLKHLPKHQAALLAKAAMEGDRGNRKEAEALLRQAANQPQSSIVTQYFLAQLAFDSGNMRRAEDLIHPLRDSDAFPPIIMLSGLLAARSGQHERAISDLQRFVALGGEDGRARFALAHAYQSVGDKSKAWIALKPLADAANASAATLQFATILTSELKLPAAQNYRARAVAAAVRDPNASQMAEADRAMRVGNWKKADAIYSSILNEVANPANVLLLNNAAYARLELGDTRSAVALARRAYEAAPGDPIVQDTLAWALYRDQGLTPENASLIRKAISTLPGHPDVQRHFNVIANQSRKSARPI